MSIDIKYKDIIESTPPNLSNDEKLRYLYLSLGKILKKSTKFFYDRDEEVQNKMYENFRNIKNNEVICKSASNLFCDLAKELGLNCTPIEITGPDYLKYNHWAIEYKNNDKRYLINPISDFYRIQMGFSTKHFCHSSEYYGSDLMPFDTMDDEYLKEMDEKLGYIKFNMYTDELLEKLSVELRSKIGTHVVRTSEFYQNYYITMLDLIKNVDMTLDEKIESIKEIDKNLEKHEEIVKRNLENKTIDKDLKTIMHNEAFKELISKKESSLFIDRDGANYVGTFDIRNLKNNSDLLIYKFNFMMECLPKYTSDLTGYIENKCFMDELSKIFFNNDERKRIHRHTVVKEEDEGNKYFMMYSIQNNYKNDNSRIYAFYDHNNKIFKYGINPVSYMIDHDLKPKKESSLNDEIDLSSMFDEKQERNDISNLCIK